MVNTLEKLNERFNDKYNYLKLLSVVYEKDILLCTITFLYPYVVEEISQEDKKEIYDFYKDYLNLNGELKIKFKKSFLDSRLVIQEVVEYFKTKKKGVFPYINYENISSENKDMDVLVKLNLNQDVLSLIDELELQTSLKEHLSKLFIANFTIEIIENEEKLPEDLDFEDIPIPITPKTRRYDVKVEKKIIGNDIVPKPEFINDNKSAKTAVILCGVLSNKNKKTFTQKKGKFKGKEKSLYTFILKDKEGGSIDCVYFCPKSKEKDMEELNDQFLTLCVGDLKTGISGKLTYYIRRLSLASLVEETVKAENSEQKFIHKKVVFPEKIPRETQSNLFETKSKYNDFIMKNKIVVFDLETTGLDADLCEITEIGAVKIENGEITERFSSFVKPLFSIPEEVQKITHITDEMVKFAPNVADVLYDFYEWSKDCIISGYNIAAYDMKFIHREAKKIGLSFNNTVIDTYIVARQSKLKVGNYKLGSIVKALGLSLVDAHRAYNDAYATAQVLMELNKLK